VAAATLRPADETLALRIETLVPYVAQHGPAMVSLVRERQAGNAQFAFLQPDGAGNEYYVALLEAAWSGSSRAAGA
jgi:hypothetical protein